MNLIVAAHSVSPSTLERIRSTLHEATGPDGPMELLVDLEDGLLAVVRPDANLVGTVPMDDGAFAALGSGLVLGHPDADVAARSLCTGGAPTQAPGDAVLVALSRSGVTASVGAGSHRLFCAELDGGTIVSSNLGVLARLLGERRRADRSNEDFLLGFGFLPDEGTVYEDVRTLGPGQHAWGSAPELATPTTAPDGASDPVATSVPSFDAAVEGLHERFLAVVDEIAGEQQEVAVLLGGFDSALVAATLARAGRSVTTYTYEFAERRHMQRNIPLVTRTVGSTERWISITPRVIMDGLWEFGRVFSQPSPQPHYQIHTLHAARRIRADGFDRVFTGDGCDAVFLGYPTVSRRAALMDRLGALPGPLNSAALHLASTRVADRHLGHVARMARSTLETLRLPTPARGHLPTRYLDDVALERLRLGAPPPQREPVTATRQRLAAGLEQLDRVRLAFHGNALTGQSRMKVDGSVTDTGLCQYTPFTHPAVRDYVNALPVEYLRPAGTAASGSGKALLVEMVRRHDLLPDAVIDMPKQSPADSPVDAWYSGELRPELYELLEHLPFEWDRDELDTLLAPKRAEELYRQRVALGHIALQAVGLLASYASFHRP